LRMVGAAIDLDTIKLCSWAILPDLRAGRP
jgi:hypothetical protein